MGCPLPKTDAFTDFIVAAAKREVTPPPPHALPYVDVLLAEDFPVEVARHVQSPGPRLVASFAAKNPDGVLPLLDREPDEARRHRLTLEALLGALDAGHQPTALVERWKLITNEALRLEGDVRIHARNDLSQAQVAWELLLRLNGDEPGLATEAFLARLARRDADAALKLAVTEERSGTDELPRVVACHLGGANVRPLLDSYLETLDEHAYRPFTHFHELAGLALRVEDAELLRRTLERAGPLGWQITMAARTPVAVLATKNAMSLPTLLDVCAATYAPAVVAGRDASAGGLHAGNVVYRPEWLSKFRPRPVETLRITAALGANGARWVPPRLP